MAADVTIVSRLRMGTNAGRLLILLSVILTQPEASDLTSGCRRGNPVLPKVRLPFRNDRDDGKIKVYTPVGTASNHTMRLSLIPARAPPSDTAAVSVLQAVPLAGIQGTITAGTKYIGLRTNAENDNEDIVFVVPQMGK